MKRLKVLHINTLDNFGGAAQVAVDLLKHVDADSHLVVLLKSTDNPKIVRFKKNLLDKIFVLFDKIFWKLGRIKSFRAHLSLDNVFNFTYSKLKKMKEYREADIIHLHNLHGGYFDFSGLEKIAMEKKIVWTLHDMWAMTGGEAYIFENENYKKGIGFTPYIKDYPMLNPLIDRRQHFLEKKKKIYAKIADSITIVPVSEWLFKCFKEAYVYDPKLKLRCIQNGIDTGIFRNNTIRTWLKPRILFFNIDIPFKGRHIFTNILDDIKHEFDLYVVGKQLKNEMTYTHFDYLQDRTALSIVYNQVDILIFPSQAENFPLTVLEAMACGVCVIASDTGGIPEMLDNSCGSLFINSDEKSLLNKIESSLADLKLVREKGKLAEKRVNENFTIEKNSNAYLELYHEIFK